MSWNVASVMTRDVVTVGPTTPYKEVAELLRSRHVSAVPVIDADRNVLGIVSEADLLLKEERLAPGPGGPLLHPRGDAAKALARNASALMSSPAMTVQVTTTLTEAARLMHRHHVKRLPVLDDQGRLVGIVSRADLLQAFIRSDDSIAQEVRDDVVLGTLVVDPDQVQVAVVDGVVRLSGELETRSLARILVRLVKAVEGVVGVDDQLTWQLDDSHIRPELTPLALRFSADERR